MGKFFTVQVKPDMNFSPATPYGSADILFNWTPFEIPTGTALLKSMQIMVAGTNGADGNATDMAIYFAKAIDDAEPSLFGVPNAAQTAQLALLDRAHYQGMIHVHQSTASDGGGLQGFNMWDALNGGDADNAGNSIILEGSQYKSGDNLRFNTPGYQTVWMAAVSLGASFDFGTDIQLNQVGNQAADMTGNDVTITIEQGGAGAGVANSSFTKGDILIGSTGGPTMEITDMVSGTATELKVKNISEQIDDNEELVLLNPLQFTLGFEM